MGRPTKAQRGTEDRGFGDDGVQVVRRLLSKDAAYRLRGQDAVPEALADALQVDLDLSAAIATRDIDAAALLAKRLLDLWDYLIGVQDDVDRDPKDGALLLTRSLSALGARRGFGDLETEEREGPTGAKVRFVTSDTSALRVWAPKEFPTGMRAEARARYPKRPRHVGEIPPFRPTKLSEWRALAAKKGPTLVSIPDAPAKAPPKNLEALDASLEKAYERIRRSFVDAEIAMTTTGDTPLTRAALMNLSKISFDDLREQTGVGFPRSNIPLLDRVQLILFHAASYTFLLDAKGKPTTLAPSTVRPFQYPILVPDAGSGTERRMPSPGLYVSVQRAGDSTFRLDGSTVSKVMFGGVGGWVTKTLHVTSIHEYQERIARELAYRGDSYVASISTDSAFHGYEVTASRVEEKIPEIVRRAVPFVVAGIAKRLRAMKADWVKIAKDLAVEVLKELILDEVKDRVIEYLVKKVGTKIIPFINLAATMIELAEGSEERMRLRHAIACMRVAIRSKTEDEMTYSASALGDILSDQFADEVIAKIVAKAIRVGKRALSRRRGDGEDTDTGDDDGNGGGDRRGGSGRDDGGGSGDGKPPAGDPSSDKPPSDNSAATPPKSAGTPVVDHAKPGAGDEAKPAQPKATKGDPKGSGKKAAPNESLTGTAKPTSEPDDPKATKSDAPDAGNGDKTQPRTQPRTAEEERAHLRGVHDPKVDDKATTRTGVDDDAKVSPDPTRGGGQPSRGGDGKKPPPDGGDGRKKLPGDDPEKADEGEGIHRVGEDTIAGEPPAPRGADGTGILRVDEDRLGVSDRDPTAAPGTGRKAPPGGRPDRPDNVGGPMNAQTAIGTSQERWIGNVPVMSRHPTVLVGQDRRHFRTDVENVIADDLNHPLRPLLDPYFARPKYEQNGGAGSLKEWREFPGDWHAGHVKSGKSGDAEVLVIQSRYRNMEQSYRQERPRTPGTVAMDEVVVVGNIAIHKQTAHDMFNAGCLNLTYSQLLALPKLQF
jgi:hypothetical protein